MSAQYEKEIIRMLDRIVKNLEILNQTLKMRTNMEVGLISTEDILSNIPFAKKSVEMTEAEVPTIEIGKDLISRQDAIDTFERSSVYAWSAEEDKTAHDWALKIISELPAVRMESDTNSYDKGE